MYSIKDLKALFGRHSVLWIGDSTSRRAWVNLLDILNAETDLQVSRLMLNNKDRIDVGKAREKVARRSNAQHCKMYNVLPENLQPYCRTIPSSVVLSANKNETSSSSTTKNYFDYLGKEASCFGDITTWAHLFEGNLSHIMNKYSLVIVGIGAWETSWFESRTNCLPIRKHENFTDVDNWVALNKTAHDDFPNGTYTRLEIALSALSHLQSPNRTVVWRTSGYHDRLYNGHVVMKLNDLAKEAIRRAHEELQREKGIVSNLTYVDWGTEILPRSRKKENERIEGDIPMHYGYEARLMMIQLLAQTLTDRQAQFKTLHSSVATS